MEVSCCGSVTHLLLYSVCRNPEISFEAGYLCQSVMTLISHTRRLATDIHCGCGRVPWKWRPHQLRSSTECSMKGNTLTEYGLNMIKPVFGICEQQRHKPACVHLHSLISTFVIHLLESINVTSKISIF